jgi:heptosyltransferase-3
MMFKGSYPPIPAPARILLIQLGDIGDVVLTTPAIKLLRRRFPDSEITVVLRDKAAGLLEEQPWINNVIPVAKKKEPWHKAAAFHTCFFLNLRRKRFDTAVDLRTGCRGAVLAVLSGARYRIGRLSADGSFLRRMLYTHTVQPDPDIELFEYAAQHHINILAPLLGDPVKAPRPELVVSPARIEEAAVVMQAAGLPEGAPVVAVHPFSLWSYKEWAPEKWKQVIKHLREKYRVLVAVTGAPEDKTRAAELVNGFRQGVFNLAGKTPLGLFPALLKMCTLVVGVDTAALHIAAAVGTRTVGIFGPSRTAVWAPGEPDHLTAVKSFPCVPCAGKGCENTGRSRCLDELPAREVTILIEKFLGD